MFTRNTSPGRADHTRTDDRGRSTMPLRSKWLLAATASAVIVIGAIAFDIGRDADSSGPPLELSLGAGDAMASCLPLEVAILADMSPAFAATATTVEGDRITLDVDRWYVGGDAETVELRSEPGQGGLIAGFDFEVGQRYLITAAQGRVNFCGYSGPATPELTALFDQAFAG